MNLILLFETDLDPGGRAVLHDRRHHHVRRILRASEGDELCVGRANGRVGLARITFLDDRELVLDVAWTTDPPPPLPVTLVLALPRPPVLGRVLAAATSFGVKRIALIHSRRVEKTYWEARAMTPEAIHEKLVLGLEQARDTTLPEIELHPRFRPFAEDVLPVMLDGATGYLAHSDGAEPCPARLAAPGVVAVGPEGGFVDFEVERLTAAGLRPVHLGPRALRVETAVPALLSRSLGPARDDSR